MKVKCMNGSEFNIKAGQDDFRQCLPDLSYHSLMIPRSAFHLWAAAQGLFNTEISQRDEDIIGASGFQTFKVPSSGYSLPSFRNKQTRLLEQMLSAPF